MCIFNEGFSLAFTLYGTIFSVYSSLYSLILLVTQATDDCLYYYEVLFHEIKTTIKKIQWEGVNIAYCVFLMKVLVWPSQYMGQSSVCNQVYNH
jgi:hypothetical protein